MTKFNELFNKLYETLTEADDSNKKETLAKLEEILKSITNSDISDIKVSDYTRGGKQLEFTYENGVLKVPMAVTTTLTTNSVTGADEIGVGTNFGDSRIPAHPDTRGTGKRKGKGKEVTRHSAARYMSGKVADLITNKANDTTYTAKVQKHFDKLFTSDDDVVTLDKVKEKVESSISRIVEILKATAEGANAMAKTAKPGKKDDDDDLDDDKGKKGKKNIEDMDDDEMDSHAYKKADKWDK